MEVAKNIRNNEDIQKWPWLKIENEKWNYKNLGTILFPRVAIGLQNDNLKKIEEKMGLPFKNEENNRK